MLRAKHTPAVRVPILGLALAAIGPILALSPVRAQDALVAPVDLRRLKFEEKCYFEDFKEKKAEDVFLRRLRLQRSAYEAKRPAELPAMEDFLAKVLWRRAEMFLPGDLKTASDLAADVNGLKKTTKAVAEIKQKAMDLVDSFSLAEAEKVEAANPQRAYEEFAKVLTSTNTANLRKAVDGIVRTRVKIEDLEGVKAQNDLSLEGGAIQKILDGLAAEFKQRGYTGGDNAAMADLRKQLDSIEKSTGPVQLAALDVGRAIAGCRVGKPSPLGLGATIQFVPKKDGKPWPPKGGAAKPPSSNKILLIAGTYDVLVFGAGSATEAAAVYARVVVTNGTTVNLAIPTQVPEGMVFVGAWAGGGGFFIDRYEVTAEQVQKLASGDAKLETVLKDSGEFKDPRLPAWFAEEANVLAWATASGKQVPTVEQWLQAAYGPYSAQELPFPWGAEAPAPGTHGYFGNPNVEKPSPCGAFPAGRSPYGVQDMVGNMVEFVAARDGSLWVLGGHYQQQPAAMTNSGGRSWLRDPAPATVAFKALKNQAEYQKYNYGGIDAEPPTSGLRMVINVK